jgi:signal transduction histidine kinase
MAICFNNIGMVHLSEGDYQNSIKFFHKAITNDEKINDKEGMAISYGNIANAYNKLHEYDVAIVYGKKSLSFAKEIGSLPWEKEANNYLSASCEGLKDFKQALFHYQQFKILNDSIFNIEKQKQITKMEAIYQNEKKQKEIEILEKDKKLKIAKIQRVQLQIYIFIGGFIFIMLFVVIIFRGYRQKQRDNLMRLEGKNDKLLIEINEQRQKHMSEVVNIQETERKRIAENLHDELGGALSAIKVNLSSWLYKNPNHDHDNKLSNIENMVDNACDKVRTIAHDLMPPELVKLGFNYAIESLVNRMSQNGKVNIQLSNGLAEKQLSPEIEIAVYRIINELLTNTLRHSKAQNASLQMFVADNILTVIAEDNGIGFDTNVITAGIGLGNIKSRVAALNGSITIDSSPNRGSSFIIDIPFKGD